MKYIMATPPSSHPPVLILNYKARATRINSQKKMLSGFVGVDRGTLPKLDIPTLGWDLKRYNRIYLLGLTNLTIIRTNEHGCMRYRGR